MAIPVDTPTVTDANLKSFTGLSGHHFQSVGMVSGNLGVVAASAAQSTISVGSSSVLLNDSKPTGAIIAEIVIDGNDIRAWDDGKTPTASQGKLLKVGQSLLIETPASFRMIAVSGVAATISIS
jgi:hypothetical protein